MLTTVTAVEPAANSFDASTTSDVTVTFDQNVAAANDQSLVLHTSQRGQLVGSATSVNISGLTATHDPADNFFAGEQVQVTVTSGVTTAGGAAIPRVWQFRAGAAAGSGEFVDSGQILGDPSANTSSQGVELGDLDGDGDLDAFVVNNAVGNTVYLNDGGVFTNGGQTLGNHVSREVALGDLDGDGDLDAVVSNDNGQGNRIWSNDGSGVFTEAQDFGGNDSEGIQIGDLDGDGDLDAFVANAGQPNRVWRNSGGVLSDTGQSLGNHSSQSVELGDLDGDGDLDAYVVNNNYQPNRIWLNDGSGSFSDAGQTLGAHASDSVDLGDIDGDGDLDAFVANVDQHNRVWLNTGDAVFTDSGQLLARANTGLGNRYTRTNWVELGDMDADGDLDAFTVNQNGGPNRVWVNDGAGLFTDSGQDLWLVPGGSFLLNPPSNSVALGDLDGDGDVDAFVANDSVGNGTPSVNRLWINRNLTPSVTLSTDSTAIPEAAGVATITATLSAAFGQPVTVSLGFSGSASNPEDYTASGAEIVIPVGSTSNSTAVTAIQDTLDEPDETVIVDITGITNGQEAGAQQVTVTIEDDDEPLPSVTLAVDNAAIAEAAGVAVFTATLSAAAAVPVTVELSFSGTASAADYTSSGTQIVIAAGATSGSATVTAVQDTADEPDETVIGDITSVTNGIENGTQQATTTILDDDEPAMPDVTLSVAATEIAEAAGVTTLTVTLSEVTTVPVTVDLELTGTAGASDYTASATQIVVAPGSTTGSVTVTAVQDEVNEPDETVIVDIASVTGGNEDGVQQQTITIVDDDAPPSFTVTALDPTASGFRVEFTNELDASELNLYDTQNSALGPADIVVTGASSGAVAGSLIVDTSSVTFIKSGGPLAADTYTVTLRSATDGFKDSAAMLLDGNSDGTGGDDYVGNFTVAEAPAGARTIRIPDFVRGPGQDVNLPADETSGIPITISDGDNVRAADIRIGYDPALLEITGATAPAGGSVIVNTTTIPGVAILVFFSSASLPAGSGTFINLQATVPTENASEIYRSQQVLDVHQVVIGDGNDNEFPVVVDDAFHFATYFADVSGNGRTNASDAAQVARFAALIDNGFAASLSTDPITVGDISGNGRINAADASRVAQFAALIDVPEIPPIPAGIRITGTPTPADLRAPVTVPHDPEPKFIDGGASTVFTGGGITGSSSTTTFNVVQTLSSQDIENASIDEFAVDAVMLDLTDATSGESEEEELTVALEDALAELLSASSEKALSGE